MRHQCHIYQTKENLSPLPIQPSNVILIYSLFLLLIASIMDFFSALHFGPLFSPTITTFSNNISSQDSSLFIANYSVFE